MTTISNQAGGASDKVADKTTDTVAGTSFSSDYQMFLKLLTTQMQNQDPMDPMDSSEYTQQLVQYSQVEQSIQQTGVLKDILSRLSTQDMAQASSLIGHSVTLSDAASPLGAAGGAAWSWSLPSKADSVVATISDARGKVVASQVVDPATTAGTFTWNGLLATGAHAAEGRYTMALTASASGSAIAGTVNGIATVTGVSQASGVVSVAAGSVTMPLSSVIKIS